MKEDHSCCDQRPQDTAKQRQGKVKSFTSYTAGATAAFLACLCCSLPLIPLMLGLSGALAFKDQLGAYHPAFEAGAIVILIGACVYMWHQHMMSGKPLHSFLLQVAVTLAMYGLMTFVVNQFLAPTVAGTTSHSGRHVNHANGKI